MKKKIVMFGLDAREIKRLSTFPGSTEFDLFAALSKQQFIEIKSVTEIDLLILQLDDEMLNRYGNALASLVTACHKFVVLNKSHLSRAGVALLFGDRPFRIFDQNSIIAFWDYMIERISNWQNEQNRVLQKKLALLIDADAAYASPYSNILLRNNFNVVYSGFQTAEDELLEHQYDLVLARAETPSGDSLPALNPSNRGYNKNTPFLFVTKMKTHNTSKELMFNEADDLAELEVCVKKFSCG